jgi:hypothetical protein
MENYQIKVQKLKQIIKTVATFNDQKLHCKLKKEEDQLLQAKWGINLTAVKNDNNILIYQFSLVMKKKILMKLIQSNK